MKYELERLKTHLKRQIESAEKLDSDWVYLTLNEAKLCLELAEAEDTFLTELEEKNNGKAKEGSVEQTF